MRSKLYGCFLHGLLFFDTKLTRSVPFPFLGYLVIDNESVQCVTLGWILPLASVSLVTWKLLRVDRPFGKCLLSHVVFRTDFFIPGVLAKDGFASRIRSSVNDPLPAMFSFYYARNKQIYEMKPHCCLCALSAATTGFLYSPRTQGLSSVECCSVQLAFPELFEPNLKCFFRIQGSPSLNPCCWAWFVWVCLVEL
jgi:hypothetical protein